MEWEKVVPWIVGLIAGLCHNAISLPSATGVQRKSPPYANARSLLRGRSRTERLAAEKQTPGQRPHIASETQYIPPYAVQIRSTASLRQARRKGLPIHYSLLRLLTY